MKIRRNRTLRQDEKEGRADVSLTPQKGSRERGLESLNKHLSGPGRGVTISFRGALSPLVRLDAQGRTRRPGSARAQREPKARLSRTLRRDGRHTSRARRFRRDARRRTPGPHFEGASARVGARRRAGTCLPPQISTENPCPCWARRPGVLLPTKVGGEIYGPGSGTVGGVITFSHGQGRNLREEGPRGGGGRGGIPHTQ